MSVEREPGLIRFTCDGPDACMRNFESDEEFRGAWAEAKAHGWVNAERGGTWTHYCPECAEELDNA